MKIGYVITADIEELQKQQDSNERNEARKQLREYLQRLGKNEEEIKELLSFYEQFLIDPDSHS